MAVAVVEREVVVVALTVVKDVMDEIEANVVSPA